MELSRPVSYGKTLLLGRLTNPVFVSALGFNTSPVNSPNARVAEPDRLLPTSQGTDPPFKYRPIGPLPKRAGRQLVLSSMSPWTHGHPAYMLPRTFLLVEIQEDPMTTTADYKRVPPIVRATSPVIPGSKCMFTNPKIFAKQYAPYGATYITKSIAILMLTQSLFRLLLIRMFFL